ALGGRQPTRPAASISGGGPGQADLTLGLPGADDVRTDARQLLLRDVAAEPDRQAHDPEGRRHDLAGRADANRAERALAGVAQQDDRVGAERDGAAGVV